MDEKAGGKKAPEAGRGRSRILYQITALLIVVLVASGLVTFFLVRGSQNRLIEQSIDKLIETEVEGIYSAYNYIGKRITRPIDELSAAAEEVMEGNLDVEIEVRRGEEFEGLKRAFKDMVESFRRYIAKSVGEE